MSRAEASKKRRYEGPSAVRRALPATGYPAIAVSIIGPDHRFVVRARAAHRDETEATVGRLARDLVSATSEVGQ